MLEDLQWGAELVGGRSIRDGYRRGWGLEHGDLREKIAADPDFQSAAKLAEGRSVVGIDKLMNLFLLVKFFLPKLPFGHIMEFGSFRGGSAFFLASLAARFLPGARVYALDTFSGIPESDASVDAHGAGDFDNTDFDEIASSAKRFGLHNLRLVRGKFSDTAGTAIAEAGTLALVHIDCDTHESVKFAYQVSKRCLVHGGYFVFDDSIGSSCIGATQAVEQEVIQRDKRLSEQIFPHHVFRNQPSRPRRSIHPKVNTWNVVLAVSLTALICALVLVRMGWGAP